MEYTGTSRNQFREFQLEIAGTILHRRFFIACESSFRALAQKGPIFLPGTIKALIKTIWVTQNTCLNSTHMLRSMNSDFSPTWAKQDRYTTMLKPMYAPWRWTLYPFTTQNHQISLPVTLWVCLKIHDTPQIYQHLMVSHHQNIWYTLIHTQKLSIVHGIFIKISQNLMISHQNLSNNDGILMVFSWFIIIFTTRWSPSCSRTNAPPDGRPQTIVALMNSNGF